MNQTKNELLKQLSDAQKIISRFTEREIYKTKDLDFEDLLTYVRSKQGQYERRLRTIKKHLKAEEKFTKDRFLNMFENLCDSTRNHKPFKGSKTKWFGVEIECTFPCDISYDDNGEEIEDDREETMNWVQSRVERFKRVTVKSDGSIKPDEGYIGIEFTVMCSREDNFSNLRKLCAFLEESGAKVNKSCGLHVHLDQRNRSESEIRRAFKNLTNCVTALSTIVPESRRNNSYCRLQGSMTNRYSAINGTALKKYNTIEVRLHSSTIDINKIINWIDLLSLIENSSSIKNTQVTTLEDLFMIEDVSERLIEFYLKRREKFSNKESEESTSDIVMGQAA